ncbi:MAG: acetate--CoA ligase family protein [Chromatiales bacterium]|nr:acetate--CoA ligase family protein [Chromatiales bacterium]
MRAAYEAHDRRTWHAQPARGATLSGVLIEPMYRRRHGRELHDRRGARPGVRAGDQLRPRRHRSSRCCATARWRCRRSTRSSARDLIRRTRAAQAAAARCRGVPGRRRGGASSEILLRVSEIVCELPYVGAMDLNPLIVDGRGAVALDARIGVDAAAARRSRYDHMAIHPYPSALIATRASCRTALTSTIRPIRPEDAAIESAFVHGLSPSSRSSCASCSALRDLTPAMLSRFTQIDYDRELALIARDRHAGRASSRSASRATRTLPGRARPASSRSWSPTSGRTAASAPGCWRC